MAGPIVLAEEIDITADPNQQAEGGITGEVQVDKGGKTVTISAQGNQTSVTTDSNGQSEWSIEVQGEGSVTVTASITNPLEKQESWVNDPPDTTLQKTEGWES